MGELLLDLLVGLLALVFTVVGRCFGASEEEESSPDPSSSTRRPRGVPVGFAATLEGQGQRCPYCHDDTEGALLACETCHTAFHAECARELRRCTTVGCGGSSELPPSERPLQIHLRPRSARLQIQARRRSA